MNAFRSTAAPWFRQSYCRQLSSFSQPGVSQAFLYASVRQTTKEFPPRTQSLWGRSFHTSLAKKVHPSPSLRYPRWVNPKHPPPDGKTTNTDELDNIETQEKPRAELGSSDEEGPPGSSSDSTPPRLLHLMVITRTTQIRQVFPLLNRRLHHHR